MKKVKSPQTTAAAMVILASAVLRFALVPLLDGDPATVANWDVVGAAVMAAYGFWKTRDQKQHEKDAGEV